MTVRGWSALAAVAALAAAMAAAAWINAGLGPDRMAWGELAAWVLAASFIGAVGVLITLRAGAARIGWLLLGTAASLAAMVLVDVLRLSHSGEPGGGGFWSRLVAAPPWFVPVFACLAMLALHFPDGRLPGPRWRVVRALSLAGYAAFFAGVTLSPDPASPGAARLEPPFPGAPGWLWAPLAFGGAALMPASLTAAAAAVAVRFRRATGIERLQLRWLAFAAFLIPATLGICGLTIVLLGEFEGTLVGALLLCSVVAVTASIAVAVTRYRLYEIDRVVNRTLIYGSVTALLAGVWFAVALAAGVVVGRDSPLSSVVATAVGALLFRPVRDRVQSVIDRRFSRARFEARHAIRRFEQAVRDGRADPERIGAVIAGALGDPGAELLYLLHSDGRCVDAACRPADAAGTPGRAVTPVTLEGTRIGVVVHDRRLLECPDLLRSVLREAALSVEVARLRLELRVQLEQVERSRERILRAGYEERRRLERDLHDGAQQRLVTLGIVLRRAERSLPREARVLAPALNQAVEEIARAVADLRALASGVRPAMLDDGLPAALEELARASAIPVELDVDDARLPAPLEATAYFVTSEAITNAIKHAAPRRVRVRAHHRDGSLRLVVEDDGAGGARVGRGGGLQGLVDRVEAHGGRLTVHSPRGRGTRLEVVLPCAS